MECPRKASRRLNGIRYDISSTRLWVLTSWKEPLEKLVIDWPNLEFSSSLHEPIEGSSQFKILVSTSYDVTNVHIAKEINITRVSADEVWMLRSMFWSQQNRGANNMSSYTWGVILTPRWAGSGAETRRTTHWRSCEQDFLVSLTNRLHTPLLEVAPKWLEWISQRRQSRTAFLLTSPQSNVFWGANLEDASVGRYSLRRIGLPHFSRPEAVASFCRLIGFASVFSHPHNCQERRWV